MPKPKTTQPPLPQMRPQHPFRIRRARSRFNLFPERIPRSYGFPVRGKYPKLKRRSSPSRSSFYPSPFRRRLRGGPAKRQRGMPEAVPGCPRPNTYETRGKCPKDKGGTSPSRSVRGRERAKRNRRGCPVRTGGAFHTINAIHAPREPPLTRRAFSNPSCCYKRRKAVASSRSRRTRPSHAAQYGRFRGSAAEGKCGTHCTSHSARRTARVSERRKRLRSSDRVRQYVSHGVLAPVILLRHRLADVVIPDVISANRNETPSAPLSPP